jgi:predicted RNA-binding Zn-ribbon protein involved in translation (DUF1610 family)
MGALLIKCPDTGRTVSTGIEIEPETFVQLPDVSARMRCPACGKHHIWRKAQAWLDGFGSERDAKTPAMSERRLRVDVPA